MTRRQQHNIESNCVSFDDDCFNETKSYHENITAMNIEELNAFKSVMKTGENFVKEITAKIKQATGV